MADLNLLLTELSICALPFDHDEADLWTVRVAWRGGDRYAVCLRGYVLAVGHPEPEWVYEPIPSSRTDEFKARTWFDYATAYRLACDQAPRVTVGGKTAADVLARADP